MSKLRLKLHKILIGQVGTVHGLLANIYDIPKAGKKVKRSKKDIESMRNLLVPLGFGDECLEVDLDPGRYLIDVRLPSGRVLSDEVNLDPTKETTELTLNAGDSPHEWLGWQQLAGHVEQDPDVYKRKRWKKMDALDKPDTEDKQASQRMVLTDFGASPSEDNSYTDDRLFSPIEHIALPVVTELVSAMSPQPSDIGQNQDTPGIFHRVGSITETDTVSRGMFFQVDSIKNANLDTPMENTIGVSVPQATEWLANSVGPEEGYSDELSRAFKFTHGDIKDLQGAARLRQTCYDEKIFERHYLFVRGGNASAQYCVLPTPWTQVDNGNEAVVEALVRTLMVENGTETISPVSVIVRDPRLATMIGYLGAGDMQAATAILKQARQLLFKKVSNPIAAAAGGYILLSGSQSEEHEYWHQWMYNLMRWFPWLPDGAILHAWVLMRNEQNDAGLLKARAYLLEAFMRGLPFYSTGVGLLRDGLTILANEARENGKKDEEVEYALKVVRNLALRTNPRLPFTTVRL